MLSLNKLVKLIQTFAENHGQLRSFYFNDKPVIGSSDSVDYPSLWSFLDKGKTEQSSRSLSFEFVILDKVREDKREQQDVLNDTELILLDLLAYLMNNQESEFLKIEYDQDYDFFIESYNDNCSGWNIKITFKTIFDWNTCAIP